MSITTPTSLSEQLGHALTEARAVAGLSRRALATRLGVADTSLLVYERGTANPTLSKVEELAEQYGLTPVLTFHKKR